MEFKSLILGLFLSIGAFAIKSGSGLAYVLVQNSGKDKRALIVLLFMAGYGMVFGAAAALVLNVNLTAHIDVLQHLFQSGMSLHLFLAMLLMAWGIHLLKNRRERHKTTRGWIPLVVPCPVCFTVICLSCSFLNAIFPDRPLVFPAVYTGFIIVSLTVAVSITFLVRNPGSAERFLGLLMIYIAVYFMLSIIVVPQFTDLDKIYRLSMSDSPFELSQGKVFLSLLTITALAIGFFNPLKRE
jgi:predicted transporter